MRALCSNESGAPHTTRIAIKTLEPCAQRPGGRVVDQSASFHEWV